MKLFKFDGSSDVEGYPVITEDKKNKIEVAMKNIADILRNP